LVGTPDELREVSAALRAVSLLIRFSGKNKESLMTTGLQISSMIVTLLLGGATSAFAQTASPAPHLLNQK
jgi:hypothetical protein